jgi:hypothetical protein
MTSLVSKELGKDGNEVIIKYQGSEENNKNICLDSQSQGQTITLYLLNVQLQF